MRTDFPRGLLYAQPCIHFESDAVVTNWVPSRGMGWNHTLKQISGRGGNSSELPKRKYGLWQLRASAQSNGHLQEYRDFLIYL